MSAGLSEELGRLGMGRSKMLGTSRRETSQRHVHASTTLYSASHIPSCAKEYRQCTSLFKGQNRSCDRQKDKPSLNDGGELSDWESNPGLPRSCGAGGGILDKRKS